jgi:hypothetical protein
MATRAYSSAEVTAAGTAAAAPAALATVEKPRPRQELAIRRFSQYCRDTWGNILFHKVGTGKTLTSLLIAFNSFTKEELEAPPPLDKKIYIVAPTSAIFQNFTKDLNDYLPNWKKYESKFVDYNYPMLINDINRKKIRYDVSGSIFIFDEAHRLLGREIFNSAEAGSSVQKHPLLEDIFFINTIYKAKKCIVMTGTPIQVDIADICRFLNFVSKSNRFNVETFAPASLKQTAKQYGVAILINWIKSLRDIETLQTDTAALAAYAYNLGTTVPYMLASANIVFLTAAAIAGYSGYQKYSSLKEKTIEKEREITRQNRVKTIKTALKNKQNGGTRKKGGFFPGYDTLSTVTYPIEKILQYSFGPGGLSKPPMDILFKFATETGIQFFQTSMEDIYLNNWQVKELAKAASPYISIYDPDIQIKLKSSPTSDVYDAEGEPFNAFSLGEQISGITNVEKISLDKLWIQTLLDPTKALDMPKAIVQVRNLTYTENQLSILREMFSGELREEYKEILNLDKYESKSPDVKQKYKFFRSYGRMIGNFSEDILKYYTVVNEDGTDYDVFERSTGKKVEPLPNGLFGCPKFEDCLENLISLRSASNTMDAHDLPAEESDDALEFRIEKYENHVAKLESLDKSSSEEKTIKVPHPHLKEGKQFLPLVYSYTEDYGLSLFCMFLKSKGYKYVLCHTNQTSEELSRRINQTKSKDTDTVTNPGFEPITDSNKDSVPLCVLIHPSMTEGYDFVYNPAIFVLEPCNTFGDQEQVYGRILRSYKKSDMLTFDNKKRKKVVLQYACTTKKDTNMLLDFFGKFISSLKTRYTAVRLKALEISKSRLFLTPQNVFTILQRAQIESPDLFAIGRLSKEKIMLKQFELSVAGGVQFGDLFESLVCYDRLVDDSRYPSPCDPMSGEPCMDAFQSENSTEAEAEAEARSAAPVVTSSLVNTGLRQRRIGQGGGKWKTRRLRKH